MLHIWYHFNVHDVQLKMKLFYFVCCERESYLLCCLLQIVNLIEETGHFHITNTTFDFDLCSLDRSTVRKLQSYLETSGLSWGSAHRRTHISTRTTDPLFLFLVFLNSGVFFSKTFHTGGSSSCMFSLPNWTEPSKETWTPETGGASFSHLNEDQPL